MRRRYPMADKKLIARVHRRQTVRHVVANKIQLALIVLRELEEGRVVPRRLAERAIKDLRAVMRFVDAGTRKRDLQ